MLKKVTALISSKTYFVYVATAKSLKNHVAKISNWSEVVSQINQEILKTSNKNHNSWEAL